MDNVGSMMIVFMPVFLVMFALSISSIAIRSIRHNCTPDDWYVFFKSFLFMNFGFAALLMISKLPDEGYQTAFSLLTMTLLFVIVPAYAIIRTTLLKKWIGRQFVSFLQRTLTLVALVFMRSQPSHQAVALWGI